MVNVKIFLKKALPLSLIFLMSFTGCSSDDDSNDTSTKKSSPTAVPTLTTYNIESAAEFFYQSMKRCHPKMKEVWPNDTNLSEANFNMILVEIPSDPETFDFESAEAVKQLSFYFINAEGKTKLSNLPEDFLMLPMALMSAGYFKVEYNGKKACAMAFLPFELAKQSAEFASTQDLKPETIALENLDTFYHESFHFYVQASKWGSASADSREQMFPINFEPRTFRVLANLHLINAYKNFDDANKRAGYYSRAKYWLDKYKNEYAAEAEQIKINDINEGTANYFGKAVCGAVFSDVVLFEDVNNQLASVIDNESYTLGSISLNLIKKEGKLNEAVTAFKRDSLTPIEALLKDVSAPSGYDEAMDRDAIAKINTAQDNQLGLNSERGKVFKQMAQDFMTGGKIYLVDFNRMYNSSVSCIYDSTIAGFEGMAGIGCNLLLGIESERTIVSNVNSLSQNFNLPGNDTSMAPAGSRYYMMPVASVDFTADTDQPTEEGALTIGIGETTSGGITESSEYLTEVKKGKITSLSQLTSDETSTLTLKDYGKTTAVFQGKDSRNNTYYIFAELVKN